MSTPQSPTPLSAERVADIERVVTERVEAEQALEAFGPSEVARFRAADAAYAAAVRNPALILALVVQVRRGAEADRLLATLLSAQDPEHGEPWLDASWVRSAERHLLRAARASTAPEGADHAND